MPRSTSIPTPGCRRWRRSAFAARWRRRAARRVVDGERSPGKVALFSTCLVNYNEPGIGRDLVAVLEHNEIPYEVVEKESCCGMPKLELGDLEGVARLKEKNIPVLARYARDGFAILTAIPSCTLMFKQELPLMFPDDADVEAVQRGDVRSVRVLRRAPSRRPAQDRLHAAARQGELPRAVPRPGAEDRQEDRGDAEADRQDGDGRADDGRALLGPRRHLRREDRDASAGDEDRPPGVQGDGRAGARLSSAPTARSPATTSPRAWRTTARRRRRCAIR